MIDTKELIAKYGINPNKALGQNFLTDENALMRIAEAAGCSGMNILEIGPGLGALTGELLRYAPMLLTVEIDSRMADVLTAEYGSRPNLRVVHRDFLKYSDDEIASVLGDRPIAIAANLPYYITSPICARLLNSRLPIRRMVLMMQEEAAGRFMAAPGDANYGPLSVLSKHLYDVSVLLRLSPASYYPAPDVNSTVLMFERNANPLPDALCRIVRAAFAMRRKTLLNNMLALMPKPDALAVIARAGLSPTVRAEALEAEDFVRLTKAYEEL